MIKTEYKQKPPRYLTEAQVLAKLAKDKEYELAVHELSTPYYSKKHSVGVTEVETEAHTEAAKTLWNDYYEWAKSYGLYEEVTAEKQLEEAETDLQSASTRVNELRTELGIKVVTVR